MVASIEMAKSQDKPEKSKEKCTSTRLFEADAFQLGMLSHKLRMSIAEYFRMHFAPIVKEQLVKVTEEELRELKSRPK